MKTHLALLLFVFLAANLQAAEDPSPNDQRPAAGAHKTLSAPALAAEVREIAGSATLSPKEKADQIAATVHDAITTAVGQLKNPEEILKTTLRFARLAAAAAPQFTAAIINGVSGIPAIAGMDGALAEIQTAVVDAATKATEADFSSDDDRRKGRHRDREPDGDKDDVVVSASH
ncbi:MAG TPA: hypothetical protein VFB27_09265 [Opitutaceae bacterium]|nr:hypothetical protein [Opitutaceae bacterium]